MWLKANSPFQERDRFFILADVNVHRRSQEQSAGRVRVTAQRRLDQLNSLHSATLFALHFGAQDQVGSASGESRRTAGEHLARLVMPPLIDKQLREFPDGLGKQGRLEAAVQSLTV